MIYPRWCCQGCGLEIGYLGRILQGAGLKVHACNGEPTFMFKREFPEGEVKDLSVVKIHALADKYREVGYLYARPCRATKTCYIVDVVVEPHFRGRGIAKGMLYQALADTDCDVLSPVNVMNDARGFWLNLLKKNELPIRIGLISIELRSIESNLKSILN